MSTFLKVLQRNYFKAILEKPVWVLVSLAVVVIVMAGFLPQLKIDASSDSLTLEYDEDLDYFREISKRYQSGDFLLVTYTANDNLFSDESLQHLKELREELVSIGGVSSVNSILDVPLLYSPKLSLLDVARGTKTLVDDGVDRQLAAEEFVNSPIYKDMLLGPDGKTTALLMNLEVDEKFIDLVRQRDELRLKKSQEGLNENEEILLENISIEFLDYRTAAAKINYERVQEVRKIVDQYQDKATLFLGGVSMITADMVDFIRSDITVFGAGILIFITVILWLIFRCWQFVLLPLLTCFTTLILMLGFLSAIDWRLTVISSNFVALLLIIGLALTVHLIVRYRELSRKNPSEHQAVIRETVSAMARPCIYTVMTTVVAFLSLIVSGIRPVIDFGWMMTISLFLSFVISFILIPAGLMVLPRAKQRKNNDTLSEKIENFPLIFSGFTERYGKLIIILGVIAAIVSAAGLLRLKVENRFIDYFHSSTEIHQGMLVIDQQLGGTISLDIILEGHPSLVVTSEGLNDDVFVDELDDPFEEEDPFAEDDPFSDGDVFSEDDVFAEESDTSSKKPQVDWFTTAGLQRVDEFHQYLEGLSEVGKVQSLATVYQVANDLNGRALSDFELAVVEQLIPKSIADLLIKPYLSPDIGQTRITMRIKETDPELKRKELIEKIHTYAVNELGFTEDQVKITGVLVLYNNMLQSLYTSQILTISAVFFGILLMFLTLFRSLVLSLIALLPNMLAALLVLGGMGLAGIPLDMMTITIAAIAVGIGVDNAIHYIYRFRKEFEKEANYISAMHRSHGSIGQAMYYTSVTIILGFSILAFSKFIPSIYFGLLTGVAMLGAILASLTLLPQLLLVIKPLGNEK